MTNRLGSGNYKRHAGPRSGIMMLHCSRFAGPYASKWIRLAAALLPLLTSLAGAAEDNAAPPLALLPPPWKDGEELRFALKLGTGQTLGAAFYSVRQGTFSGRPTWKLNSRMFSGVHAWSQVQADADSLRPLHSRWKHGLRGDVTADYTNDSVTLQMRGEPEPKKVSFKGTVYDNEELLQLLRRLPLTNDYSANVPLLSTLAGGTILPLAVRVEARQQVTVPAGTYDCFKVELSGIHQTFWYSSDAQRWPVKFESGGAIAELTEIPRAGDHPPEKYVEPAFGFSILLPSGWRAFRVEPQEDKTAALLICLDPEAVGNCSLRVQNQTSLAAEQKVSLRAWAESQLRDKASRLEVRPHGWKELMVAGHPALAVTADYPLGKDKRTNHTVFTFGALNAAWFNLDIAADQFDAFLPQFEALLSGYKAN